MDRKKKKWNKCCSPNDLQIQPNLSQRSRRICFVEIGKLIQKFICKCNQQKMTEMILKKSTDEQLALRDLL